MTTDQPPAPPPDRRDASAVGDRITKARDLARQTIADASWRAQSLRAQSTGLRYAAAGGESVASAEASPQQLPTSVQATLDQLRRLELAMLERADHLVAMVESHQTPTTVAATSSASTDVTGEIPIVGDSGDDIIDLRDTVELAAVQGPEPSRRRSVELLAIALVTVAFAIAFLAGL